ncbi:4'-phosphopantetheinyl transferase superfamily protein [Sorangium sp. So ce834]|uniref:4'-phosphopantetheinyl transferase superfamily protein n=1 Tax=Sorangium sp. So ce834 TaxID=3133321 RepID=UPI003F610F83
MTPPLAIAIVRADEAAAARLDPYLTAGERRVCAGQRAAARRAQSACARVAAKWLRLELAAGRGAPLVSLDAAALEAHPRADYLACAITGPGGGPPRFEDGALALSLSHAGDLAAAAVTTARAVGVDVERVEARAAAFADEHFTPRERDGLARGAAAGAPRAALETLLWSAKEALYKTGALDLPARFSFRDIDVAFPPGGARLAPPSVRAFALTARGGQFFGRAVLTGAFALVATVPVPPAIALG